MRPRRDSIEVAKDLNTLRKSYQGTIFNRVGILEILAGVLPKDNGLLGICVKVGILTRVKRGSYSFPESPIHYSKVETFYSETSRSVKKKEPDEIDRAIDLLEKNGFVVTNDPILPKGSRLSDALKLARSLGYSITKF